MIIRCEVEGVADTLSGLALALITLRTVGDNIRIRLIPTSCVWNVGSEPTDINVRGIGVGEGPPPNASANSAGPNRETWKFTS